MAAISPTPLPVSSFPSTRQRHAAVRTFPLEQPSRSAYRRLSPLDSFSQGQGFSADAPMIKDISIGDSSDDDDIPQPMNFSALTRAILEDKSLAANPRSPRVTTATAAASTSDNQHSQLPGPSRLGTPSRGALRITRKSPQTTSTEAGAGNPSPPRVVHLSGSRNTTTLRRSLSSSEGKVALAKVENRNPQLELITPAPATRRRPALHSRANSSTSIAGGSTYAQSVGSKSGNESHPSIDQDNLPKNEGATEQGDASPQEDGPKCSSKTTADGLPGSTRLKRVPLGSGTFLRGAPVRRPLKPRQSEEDASFEQQSSFVKRDEDAHRENKPLSRPASRQNSVSKATSTTAGVQGLADSPGAEGRAQALGRSLSTSSHHKYQSVGYDDAPAAKAQSRPASPVRSQDHASAKDGEFKMSAPPILPSALDQENEPPPTFKRNKQGNNGPLTAKDQVQLPSDQKDSKMLAETAAIKSPRRQALALKSINTPQRPAPPPPKMSVLETATATAGASTVKSKKKRSHITINGKTFYLRGRLGRGGSSDVYRVMTDNDKIFAWKKVNLEDCNEDTVRGYKGEIDLLKKLENVDRVVRLFDWEVHEEKQSLSVLMEAGESDLNRILAGRLQPENATLDVAFIRHYWAEMLHCVAAVHAHDIVHSDLKPANFLLVQGRLKLIDFGIANAIDTENTVNVHRENNVGTPNYMSPESLQDTNANGGKLPGGQTMPKLMKLGKPSDVWSLGCILYQMTYGKPPFAHIANQWNRVLAITNPTVAISYSSTGVGDVPVPTSLQHVLKACLNRDPNQRPTLEYLLSDREPFLHPETRIEKWDAEGAVPVTENILEQIIGKIVERCRDGSRGLPTEDERRVYSRAFLDRVRALQKV